jgi:hypothetical protein
MKILHVSTFDCDGGAARAAYRLHTGLRSLGADSSMYVVHKESLDPSVVQYQPPTRLRTRISRTVRREILLRSLRRYESSAPFGLANFSDDRSVYAGDAWRNLPEQDLLHLHWIADFVDYAAFFTSLPRKMPVVWTLHDMAPFTGGCHWSQGCPKFAQECGACPQLGSQSNSDWTRRVWQRK